MNLYGALNNDLREFKKKEQIKILENEEVKESILKPTVDEVNRNNTSNTNSSVTKPSAEDIAKDDAEIDARKRKEIEDKVGELRLALEDGVSEDEKKEIEKEINDLEDSLNESTSRENTKLIKDEEVPEVSTKDEDINEQECLKDSSNDISSIDDDLSEVIDTLSKTYDESSYVMTTLNSIHERLGKIYDEEPVKDSEEIKECEVKSSRVIRKSPKFSAYMIEAETKDGMVYLTGRNYDADAKILDEAEVSDNKDKATERFKSLLK